MARDGAGAPRPGPKPPLTGATLRKAVMAIWPELTDEGVWYAFWYKPRISGRVGKRRGRGSKRLESVVGL
jgi:hypothetical protein